MSRLDELIKEYCPDGIRFALLKDVTTKIVDGMHNLPKGLSSTGKYPVISAQNISNDSIDMSSDKYADEDVFRQENGRTRVETGDILLTIVGAIGRSAIVSTQRMLFQRSVCVITPNQNLILSGFLKYVFDSDPIQERMIRNAH